MTVDLDRPTAHSTAPSRQTTQRPRFTRHPRRVLRQIPRAAWICAFVAILNAVGWSILTPPFQAPDEPSHFAYVQHLAETGDLPASASEDFPPGEEIVLNDLNQSQVRFSQEVGTISTAAQQRELETALSLHLSRSEPAGAGLAASQPPLYYALEVIPYKLAAGGTLLDQLELMRLLSALMGGVTALFVFFFVREVLPSAPWAWSVGGLSVALMPALAMMSGAVNPDALLFAVSAILFYCLARAFRRGLTIRLGLVIGAVIAAGMLTKLTFVALVPGALLGLLALAWRGRETQATARYAKRPLLVALGVTAVPVGLYVLHDVSSSNLSVGVFSGAVKLANHGHSLGGALSYIWQLYLPRLPGMTTAFHGTSGGLLWFRTAVGLYGWLDTTFPSWVITLAIPPAVLLIVLFVRSLTTMRSALRARWMEAAVYVVIALGLLVTIGVDEYIHGAQGEYLQLRYLLPLVALTGVVLALAARGAGRRFGPIAGAFIVLLFLAHDLFSQLLVISRYYG